jgi:hypothetical protein
LVCGVQNEGSVGLWQDAPRGAHLPAQKTGKAVLEHYVELSTDKKNYLKGTVRPDETGVESDINRKVLILGFTAIYFFRILMGLRALIFEKLLNVREWRRNRRFLKNMASHYSMSSVKPIFIIPKGGHPLFFP